MNLYTPGKNIAICSDHAGYQLKELIKRHLEESGMTVQDFGTFSDESCDYPDFAHPAAENVESGICYPGIAICGTGNGIAMTLNKHQGIRAALCWNTDLARLARGHNNANFLVLPGRFIDPDTALAVADTFISSEFEGGRHQRRIEKIPVR